MNKKQEELKSFLILKYGSLANMYNSWMDSTIDNLTEEEKDLLSAWLGVERWYVDSIKEKHNEQNKV